MPPDSLEQTLKNLSQFGEMIAQDNTREVWRFEHAGKPLRLHFYERGRARGNPALRELQALQRLQKAEIPSPHAYAAMVGFRLGDRTGDALVLDSIEPAMRLDEHLEKNPSQRIHLRRQLIEILHQFARAGLGHRQLDLRSFLVRNDELLLDDARGVQRGGLKLKHLLRLGHSAAPIATRSDYLEVWRELIPDRKMPLRNPVSHRLWQRFIRTIFSENDNFGLLSIDGWSGVFTRRPPWPVSWARASEQCFTAPDWLRAWPELLRRVEANQLEVIKRADNGDVLAGDIVVGGRSFSVVVKRPRRKYARQVLGSFLFGSRAKRTWAKTWKMLVRAVPCEWPMLLMERRVLGYAVESLIVFERVPGATLAAVDLDQLDLRNRENLFRRAGRTLRKIEDLGFTHTDAKSTNWIVFNEPRKGATPILIDVDGVRHYRWSMMGIERLLRAMKQHPQYTPENSFHLCQGFAPRAKLERD